MSSSEDSDSSIDFEEDVEEDDSDSEDVCE